MKRIPGKQARKEFCWFATLAALVMLLFGVAYVKLSASRARTRDLSRAIDIKLDTLRQSERSEADSLDLATKEETLTAWRTAASNPSARISAISTAAESAGITVMSLRDLDTIESEDGLVATFGHSLRGVGTYKQIGVFLDALYAAPEMIAVEGLELARDDESGPGRVEASMRVTWHAPAAFSSTQEGAAQ